VARRNIRLPGPVTIALLVVCVLLLLRLPTDESSPIESAQTESATVQRVIDGDTVELTDGTHVRFLGIDSPELAHRDTPAEPGAIAARDWLRNQIEGEAVTLRYGSERHDRYGRTLAWIYDSDGTLVNLNLLFEGHARLVKRFGLPEDLRTELHQAVARARVAQRGIWKKRR